MIPVSFQAGDKAPTSGVYKVLHYGHHAHPHYVTLLYGEILPSCLQCSSKVNFEVAMAAVHVRAHPSFMRDQDKAE